jgi:hypothetical protein
MQLLSILRTTNHLSQLVLAGEVGLESIKLRDDIAGTGNNSFLGCDLAISLNAKFELSEEGMRDLNLSACLSLRP